MNRIYNLLLFMCVFGAIECKPDNPLIVGGGNAKRGETPWMVSLSASPCGNRHFCGGSILDSRTILTAAHCVKGLDAVRDDFKARIGSLVRDKGGVQYNVSKIIVHPHYVHSTIGKDVAILKMASDMIVTGNINGVPVSTVRLPTGGELPAGMVVKVAGWGYSQPTGPPLLEMLQVVQVPIVSRDICRQGYVRVTSDMVCAGRRGQDSCKGDSGGPLIKGDVIYGIVSWGDFPCANPLRPGVYANVVALRDWIIANKS